MKRIMIIAGEVSGDMHAANLVRAVSKRQPDIEWFGIGGPQMREAGVETLYDVSDMAVMGLAEVLRRYPFFRRVFNQMLQTAEERHPDAILLVDYPGFNLRLAEALHAKGIRVLYYVCPQVWAWHRERIPKMARIIDHLITIFPFEADHFAGTGLKVSFAGHPLVDEATHAKSLPDLALPWAGPKRVALLPGSRTQEIRRLLPVMLKSACLLQSKDQDISFIVATPSEAEVPLIRGLLEKQPLPSNIEIVSGRTREILRQADAVIVASGTATIEAALMRCPMVIIYKVNPITYILGRLLIKIDHIGMVNIVAGGEICPELVQSAADQKSITSALLPLIDATDQRTKMLHDLDAVATALGHGGAADRAAEIVLSEI